MIASKDLFIRRAYTLNDISIVVDIDLVSKTVTLSHPIDFQKQNGVDYEPQKWLFEGRTIEYMGGWSMILSAMQSAIQEATKVLGEAKDRDDKEFEDLLLRICVDDLDKSKTFKDKKGEK